MTLNETHIVAKEQTIPYIAVTWYNAYFKKIQYTQQNKTFLVRHKPLVNWPKQNRKKRQTYKEF